MTTRGSVPSGAVVTFFFWRIQKKAVKASPKNKFVLPALLAHLKNMSARKPVAFEVPLGEKRPIKAPTSIAKKIEQSRLIKNKR